MIHIANDGPRILDTDYWTTPHAARGACYLSINAGAFRLLVPPALASAIGEMVTAKTVVVSRGPWPEQHKDEAIEVLFDDGTSSPYAIHIGAEQVDRLPLDTDASGRWRCSVWTVEAGATMQKLERPAVYRRSKRLPDLRPAP
jgi:hypothetical protein